MTYTKYKVEGVTVLEVGRRPWLATFGLRANLVPIGLAFRHAGNGWAVVDFVPWDTMPPDAAAGPDDVEREVP